VCVCAYAVYVFFVSEQLLNERRPCVCEHAIIRVYVCVCICCTRIFLFFITGPSGCGLTSPHPDGFVLLFCAGVISKRSHPIEGKDIRAGDLQWCSGSYVVVDTILFAVDFFLHFNCLYTVRYIFVFYFSN
jgi:hypothetical protein